MEHTPTLQEEIVRKAYETIEKLETDRERGAITPAQFGYGVDILWSAAAGLVDSDFVTAMEYLNEKRKPAETKLVLMNEAGVVVRITHNHKDRVTYTVFVPGKNATNHVFDYKDSIDPLEDTRTRARALLKGVLLKGFTLL